ncbi:hypothetical protein P7K49_033221 [Saguinus oedipus]|uniref:Complement C3/4/5 macroglobulin domain-containing protein n=1 Tax=Saguinus oedipus TaxID=9490 RepID=A0ABQ9TRA9_SAGOE|nr:hypothetical protein P7K49_033221 [Saguinus oedipus]
MDVPWPLGVGSPENIHIQAHSDSRQPLTRTLEVNLTVWDFPRKKTVLARNQLILSPGNNFMGQAPVTVPESLVYPPQPGQQYVIIHATWAPTSVSSFMEKMVLVAPHAGYIFIQTDKTIYTPEHLVQYRVFTVNHRMDPVTRIFTLDIKVVFPDGGVNPGHGLHGVLPPGLSQRAVTSTSPCPHRTRMESL